MVFVITNVLFYKLDLFIIMNFRNYGDFNMNMSLLSLLYILPHILFMLMENGYVAEMARTIGAKVCSTYDDFATELNIIIAIAHSYGYYEI